MRSQSESSRQPARFLLTLRAAPSCPRAGLLPVTQGLGLAEAPPCECTLSAAPDLAGSEGVGTPRSPRSAPDEAAPACPLPDASAGASGWTSPNWGVPASQRAGEPGGEPWEP